MKTSKSRLIPTIIIIASALLFSAGCGSENSGFDDHHSNQHMDEHASHSDMAHIESAAEEDHHHEGGHHSTEIMEQPANARLVTITATDFAFSPADISAKPGEKLFIKLVNEGKAVHMWQLRDRPETHVHTPVGETSAKVVTAPEASGKYDVVCTTPGHEELGMVGKLTVSE